MLWVLVKKQVAEVFKGYFYDAKKNRMRSKWAVVAYFALFFALMVGLLGGSLTALSVSFCVGLAEAGMGWLYFVLMGGIAILLGAFGSVFNSYSALYLAKDNDLLLSMPIPVRTIITARLINVYLLGTMYSATALVPALIVYWAVAGADPARIVCGLALFLIITVVVMLLSCVLGWVVARISLRLKNRSFVTVLISLLFIGAYYFFYFKANGLIRDILLNAVVYGEQIKGAAYGLYLFGRIGEGDWAATAIFAAVTAAAFVLVRRVLTRSFLSVATSDGNTKRVRYVEKRAKEKTAFAALLGKEFARFASSPNYMLNCGLGVLLIPAGGVLFLIKGREIYDTINAVFSGRPGGAAILVCTMLCLLSSMNDMAAPSVSLEGKSIWIPQSLPVHPKTVLRAKTAMHLILTALPMLFAAGCAAIIVPAGPAVRLLLCSTSLLYVVFSALYGTVIGIRMPILSWTNEVAPIKQSGAVTLSLFSGWGFCVALAGLYLLVGYKLGAEFYLLLWTGLLAAASLFLRRWLDTKGAEAFAAL